MRNVNKLVALLLAAVMVLGMMPTMTVHAHAHEHDHNAVETQGIEEYPVLTLDTEYTASITYEGEVAYFTFTPETTHGYTFASYAAGDGDNDTVAWLYDSSMNELEYNDTDSSRYDGNFALTYTLEAGVTYVYGTRYWSTWTYNSYPVMLTSAHEYVGAVTTAPTCDADGVMTYTCAHCDASYTEPIPAAHTWGEDGYCTVCGAEYLITGVCGDDLTWTLDFFGNLNISGTGAMYDFADASSTPWADHAVEIKNVVLGEGATTLGDSAFYNCYNLAAISLPSTLTSIGGSALRKCDLTSLVVPEGVTSIGYTAIGYNYDLTEVSLPSTLTTLGEYAFYSCNALTNVAVPDSVTSMGASVFASCGNLTTIKLPASMETLPAGTFNNCYALANITWPENLTTIGERAFRYCGITEITIPEGVTTIASNAFSSSSLKTVSLPSTLTTLEYGAFEYNWYLSCIIFTGDAPTSINSSTFTYAYADAYYPAGNETWTTDKLQNYGGTLTWHALCAEHSFSDWTEPNEATCTKASTKTRTCSECGWTETEVLAEALGHDYIAIEVVPVTCVQYGYTLYRCTRCGDTYEGDRVWSTGHQYEETVVEPTCSSEGYTTFTCTVCGDSYNGYYTSPLPHTVESWSEPTEATCTEDGVKTGTCTVCGQTVTEVVTPALGHTWGEEGVENADGSVTYTCTACGATYSTEAVYLSLGDNIMTMPMGYGGTEKTKTYTAEQDGNLIITVTAIRYFDDWMYEYTGDGWTEVPLDRAFGYAWYTLTVNDELVEYTNTKTITVAAGDVVTVQMYNYYYYESEATVNLAYEGAAHEHAWSDWTVTTPATCTTDGEQTRTCECGETETEVIPATGHTWDEGVVTEATCDEAGYTTYTCTVCSETDVPEDSVTEPLDHDWQSAVTEPTCTERGYTTWTCARCGDSYVDEDSYTDALGHSYESVVTEPTCTEGGYTTHTCAVCGDSYTDAETEATGHSWKGLGCENCDATRENPFVDVPEDSFYIDPVLWAVEKGITTGTDETHFNPNGDCLRAAVVTFLWRAAGEPEPTTAENPFTDVKEGDFYYKAVLWAVENGITNGTSATTFSPMDVCNRAQVVTFLWRAMGEPAPTTTEHPFTDVVEGMFYMDAMLWAVETGVTNGLTNTTFGPLATCNRAQVVTFLYRAYTN